MFTNPYCELQSQPLHECPEQVGRDPTFTHKSGSPLPGVTVVVTLEHAPPHDTK